ncbi:NADPH-dependent FMN reductase [Oceanobacter mangrovi]|uniref:NADPH-dependent FMN reductase n=1 Tax=Oceanobacter mangrovi TaxID=2862510 RepID=UPI001C8E36BC|nr:NAD(P)H-dependent oxidoreductase [Oceanobacter mangrovi]
MSDIRTAIVSTAHRPDSQSLRVSQVLKDEFLQGNADIIDLYADALPMWDGVTAATDNVSKTLQTIDQADALIFVIPEWHGMAPAGLKNLLLWCGAQQQMAHKPVLLVGISAAVGGAFVIAEVRSSGYKNTRLVFTPEHLILRGVGDLWKEEGSASGEEYLSKRTRFAVEQLLDYATALKPIRSKLVAAQAEFGNGMS